jgi:hypothetical protein
MMLLMLLKEKKMKNSIFPLTDLENHHSSDSDNYNNYIEYLDICMSSIYSYSDWLEHTGKRDDLD